MTCEGYQKGIILGKYEREKISVIKKGDIIFNIKSRIH